MQLNVYNLLDEFLETLEFNPYNDNLHTMDTLSNEERTWLVHILEERYASSTNVRLEEK